MKNSISNSIGSTGNHTGNHTGNNHSGSHTQNTKTSFGMVNPNNVIKEQSEVNENVLDVIAKKLKNSKPKTNNIMNSTNPVNNPNLIQNLMIGKFNSLYPKSNDKDGKANSNSLYSMSNVNMSNHSITKLNITK